MEDLVEIKEEIANFYEELYSSETIIRQTLNSIYIFFLQSMQNKVWMERSFDEEVNIALVDCVGDKAPGPDGFIFNFIKAALDIIK